MRWETRRAVLLLAIVLATGSGVPAEVRASDVAIALATPDDHVERNFTVTRAGGKKVPALVTVQGFDQASRALVFKDVRDVAVSVPVAELESVTFTQDVRRQSPIVQAPLRQIAVRRVEQRTVIVPAAAFTVDAGSLRLPDVPAPARGERWEMRSVTYDAAKASFVVAIERVEYTVTTVGTGGTTFGAGDKGIR